MVQYSSDELFSFVNPAPELLFWQRLSEHNHGLCCRQQLVFIIFTIFEIISQNQCIPKPTIIGCFHSRRSHHTGGVSDLEMILQKSTKIFLYVIWYHIFRLLKLVNMVNELLYPPMSRWILWIWPSYDAAAPAAAAVCRDFTVTPLAPSILYLELLNFQGIFSLKISCLGIFLGSFWKTRWPPEPIFFFFSSFFLILLLWLCYSHSFQIFSTN